MQIQYIVGLCCLRRNPDAVEITIGDMVMDSAAEKARDVDITVTLQDEPGIVRAFKAYEVKRETPPLDVVAVEQLCAKFGDMPSVTHPAIVSASGYTAPAIKKAASHKVELYQIKPWDRPIAELFPAFPGMGKPEDCLHFGRSLLFWLPGRRFYLVVPEGPSSFNLEAGTPIFDKDGSIHPRFATVDAYQNELMMRSTQILFQQEPATSVRATFPQTVELEPAPRTLGPAWPHTHTLDVIRDGTFLRFEQRVAAIEHVTISGHLQWQGEALVPQYHVLVRVPDGEVFAGAAISLGLRDDELFGVIFSPDSRTTGVHQIKLTERQRNAIRDLKLRTNT